MEATLDRPDPQFALPKANPIPDLLVADRCDRCGAQAYVTVRLAGGQLLLFCAHHFTEHEAALIAGGYEIKDERTRLDAANSAYKSGA
jgi:hypothetical protein